MTTPLNVGAQGLALDDVNVIVDALIANAQRLGLKWFIRPGTVVDANDPGAVQVLVDGDDDATRVTSMIGTLVRGVRVFLLIIPEVGTYVIGWIGLPHYVHNGETGVVTWTFVTQTSQTVAVVFKKPYATAPFVACTIVSGSGTTQSWFSRPTAVTTVGFTMWVHGPSASWTNISVRWVAIATAPS